MNHELKTVFRGKPTLDYRWLSDIVGQPSEHGGSDASVLQNNPQAGQPSEHGGSNAFLLQNNPQAAQHFLKILPQI